MLLISFEHFQHILDQDKMLDRPELILLRQEMQHSGCYNIRSIEKASLHYTNLAPGVVRDTTIKYLLGQMAELALLAG